MNEFITSTVTKQAVKYIQKEPIKNFNNLLELAGKIKMEPNYESMYLTIKAQWQDENSTTHQLITRLLTDANSKFREKFLTNFLLNASVLNGTRNVKARGKYGVNIPWTILMDPTSACNLKCVGCWAGEYDKKSELSNEVIDRVITEAKELGMYFFIFSGGEPLVRRWELIELAKKHDDCFFLSFTNATLIDEKFADAVAEVGNLTFAISIEGFEVDTDFRRGKGTYKKVINAMALLKERGVPFGYSACYHSKNYEAVGSDEFIDFMVDVGAYFTWLFTYIPIGKDAVKELICTPEQRAYMFNRVREIRNKKALFMLDFWNDGQYVGGCVAGGRRYFHINSEGEVEPCAFIHYSCANINEMSLLDALKNPLFNEYSKHQPFNENPLAPCPLLDNPTHLRKIVKNSGAYSTQPIDEESVYDLTAKTDQVSKEWIKKADEIWLKQHEKAMVNWDKICSKEKSHINKAKY